MSRNEGGCGKGTLLMQEMRVTMGIPVKLQVFEGPLDLLLHLIEKNKVNIYGHGGYSDLNKMQNAHSQGDK